MTRDPIVSATRAAYEYAANSPLNATDPSGLSPNCPVLDGGFCIDLFEEGGADQPGLGERTRTRGRNSDGVPFLVPPIGWPDDDDEPPWVIRGGLCTLESFQKQEVDAQGRLTELSVQFFPGRSQSELARHLPNNKVGVTTAELIYALGGKLTPDPTWTRGQFNPHHLRTVQSADVKPRTLILRTKNELWSPPISVDFMHTDWDGRVRLDLPGTRLTLEQYEVALEEGRRLVLYDEDGDDSGHVDDLIGLGIATFDDAENRWVASGCERLIHFSDLDPSARALYQRFRPENGQPYG